MQVAQTILEQLGGNKFLAMTGAKNIVGGKSMVQFKIGRGAKNGATNCRIEIDADDTYSVKFYSIRGVNVREISTDSMVYADQLQSIFTARTGFDCSL